MRALDDRSGRILVGLVLGLTVLQLLIGTFAGFQQFEGKGFGYRLAVYPVLMLVAPLVWWRIHRGRDVPVPWGAFALVMAPFLVDVTGNTLDLYDTVDVWDNLNHFANWWLLLWGLGLLLAPSFQGARWALALVVVGLGAVLAIGWEIGEWYTFIRRGTELDGAYEDTLSDELLGTLGAACAAAVLTWRRAGRPASAPEPK